MNSLHVMRTWERWTGETRQRSYGENLHTHTHTCLPNENYGAAVNGNKRPYF